MRDIADVSERFAEPQTYTRIGFGPASDRSGEEHAAVTIAVAKKKGTNAVAVANQVLSKVADLERDVIPSDVRVTVTRNSGKTAVLRKSLSPV